MIIECCGNCYYSTNVTLDVKTDRGEPRKIELLAWLNCKKLKATVTPDIICKEWKERGKRMKYYERCVRCGRYHWFDSENRFDEYCFDDKHHTDDSNIVWYRMILEWLRGNRNMRGCILPQ